LTSETLAADRYRQQRGAAAANEAISPGARSMLIERKK
jgi:hypothetical protein